MNHYAKFTRGWRFVLPSVVIIVLVVGVPLYQAASYSLHDVLLYRFRDQPFIGLSNYSKLMADPLFIRSATTTLVFTVWNTVLCTVLGLLIAYLLSSKGIRYRSFFMACFLVPFVMTQVVVGLAFKLFIWEADFGVVNFILGGVGLPTPAWLIDGDMALTATILTNTWRLTPLALLVFYAALTTIPEEQFEAARLDGAGPMTTLVRVVIPQISHHIIFVTLMILTSAFREFDTIFTLTGGGPGRETMVLSILAWQRGLSNQDMGYASAIAFTMFLIVAVVSWLFLTISKPRSAEEGQ